jgi:hypothetical protein
VGGAAQGSTAAQHGPSYFLRSDHDRTLDRLHHVLYVQRREEAGRGANP